MARSAGRQAVAKLKDLDLNYEDQALMLAAALRILMSDIDYRNGACRPDEPVGAVVNPVSLVMADNALEMFSGAN
jgi:hypothetical protein